MHRPPSRNNGTLKKYETKKYYVTSAQIPPRFGITGCLKRWKELHVCTNSRADAVCYRQLCTVTYKISILTFHPERTP